MQCKPGSIEDSQADGKSVADPARARRGEPAAAANSRAGTGWEGSSFDLAQGLDVKVMESKLSREMLDDLFRS